MIRFLLLLFAVVVFVMLAFDVAIHTDQGRWAYGAFAAAFASQLVEPAVAAYSDARRR